MSGITPYKLGLKVIISAILSLRFKSFSIFKLIDHNNCTTNHIKRPIAGEQLSRGSRRAVERIQIGL